MALAVASTLLTVTHLTAFAEPPGRQSATAELRAETSRIGRSVEGRPIRVGCLGTGDQMILMVGGMHTGIERNTAELGEEIADAIAAEDIAVGPNTKVCIIPVLNPDGLANGTRTNANNVDLNRNWPTDDWQPEAYHPGSGTVSGGPRPLSEPETRALYDYIQAERPVAVIVWHSYGGVVEANDRPGAETLARDYARGSGLDYIDEWSQYAVTGQFMDAMDALGIAALDVELERPSSTGFEQHREAVETILRRLDAGALSSATGQRTAPAPRFHRLLPGDTMLSVALRFNVSVTALAETNHIREREDFLPGRVLLIPRAAR